MVSVKKQALSILFIFLLFNATLIYADEAGENLAEKTAPQVPAQAQRDEFSCDLESMSTADSFNFLELLRDGYLGSEYGNDSPENENREELDNSTLIIPLDRETGAAQKVDLADQKFDVTEAQHIMNDWINGAFSYGLVLTDTLRVGRCVNLKDENIPCPVEGKQLNLRNSGAGFTSYFKPLGETAKATWQWASGGAVGIAEKAGEKVTGEDLNWVDKEKGDWTDEDYTKLRNSMGLPENAQQALSEHAVLNDLNEVQVFTMSRQVEAMVSNSILAQNFYAYSQTTCNTSDCTINVYSIFDKYYNNWFSVDIVMGIAGPTLFSRAKKLLMSAGRRGNFKSRLIDSKLMDAIRRQFYSPDGSALARKNYNRLITRMRHRSEIIPEVGKLRFDLMETTGWLDGMYLVKSRPFRDQLNNEWMKQGGMIDSITQGRIQKEVYQFAEDVRQWQRVQKTLWKDGQSEYMKVYKQFGAETPQEIAARTDFGRKLSTLMTNSEDAIHLDLPEWFARDGSGKLFPYAVKAEGTDATKWLAHDSVDIYSVMKKFGNDGDWAGSWASSGGRAYDSTGRNLNLYQFDPTSAKTGEATGQELRDHFSHFTDLMAKTDPGEVMPVTDATLPYVSNVMTGKKATFAGHIAKAREMAPDEFAGRLVNNPRLNSFFSHYGSDNADQLVLGLQSKGFMKRNYTSLLDKAMVNQHELFKNYFGSVKGMAKWTAYFNGYWFVKQGLGQESFSGYMLPDSWREIRWPIGSHELYNDAFIDFFAQEGSNEGDLFRKVIDHMPIEWVASIAIGNYEPANDAYEKFAKKQVREKVENLAFYSSTEQDCDGCGVSLDSGRNFQTYSIFYFADSQVKNFMVEDVVSKEAKEKGSTIITFAHHTNLEGYEVGSGTGNIDLREAILNKETCQDKVEEFAWGLGRHFYQEGSPLKPSTIGGVLAFSESIAYATAGWFGIFASFAQQAAIAPQFQDCVDADEGYYTHIFVPTQTTSEKKEEAGPVLSTDKAMEVAEGFSDQLLGMFTSDTNSYTSQAAKELDNEVNQFFASAEQNDIVQATVEIPGFSSGKFSGEQLFSFWFKGETSPLEYKTEGMKKITSQDGNTAVIVDFESGKAFVVDANGNILQELTDNNLAVATSSTNTNIPAEEFGKNFTLVGLPDSTELLFEMNVNGDLIVKHPEVIDCLVTGIEFQSGIPTKSESSGTFNLTPIFGKVQAVVTDSHPAIRAWSGDKLIVAEGTPRLTIEGPDSMVKLHADRNTYLWQPDGNSFVGLFKSIQFKNGVILYKPDTHELLVWLKRHELGQLSQDDVAGMRLAPNTVTNPETGCPEPAIDMQLLASDNVTASYKVNAFNQALQNVGPFTVFETPTRRFIFYAQYNEDGQCVGIECCEDHIRIIDKETGEIYDSAIEDMTVSPDGIHITDADGKEHDLGFSAENGVPMVTYNNFPPEPLTMAQGPNGSFWYDPENGIWNAENAQLLPLLEAFKNGSLTQVGPGGNVTSTAGGNIMNVDLSGEADGGLFNLPSLPVTAIELMMYFSTLVMLMYAFVYRKRTN